MATTTLDRLIELLGRNSGFYFAGVLTGGDTDTIIDTSGDGFDALATTKIVGKWARIVVTTDLAAPQGEYKKVTSVSTSTAELDHAYSATVAASDTYEFLPHNPQDMIDAIQTSIRQAWPTIYAPLRDETLIVDNLLADSSFEINTTGPVAFTSWSNIGSPTLTAETSRTIHGSQCIGIAASGATEGVEQDIFPVNVVDGVSKSVHVTGWIWCGTASSARLRVSHDGSTYTNSDWHTGTDQWEYFDFSSAIPADGTETMVSLEVENGITAYFDLVTAWVDPISQYTIPSAFVNGPHRISGQADNTDPSGYFRPLTRDSRPAAGSVLRLEGKGPLSVPTTGTGTTEISEIQAEFIVANAARIMFNRLIVSEPANADSHRESSRYWSAETERLTNVSGVRSPRMTADLPSAGVRRSGADTSGRYMELPR